MQNYVLTSGYYNPHSKEITLESFKLFDDLKEFILGSYSNKHINKLSIDLLKNIKNFVDDLFGLILVLNGTDKIFLNEFSENLKIKKKNIEIDGNIFKYKDLFLKIDDKYIYISSKITDKNIIRLPDNVIQRIDPDLDMEYCTKSLIYDNNTIKLRTSTLNKRTMNIYNLYFYSDIEFEIIDKEIKIIYNSLSYSLNMIRLDYSEGNDRINLLVSSGISMFLMTLIGYTI